MKRKRTSPVRVLTSRRTARAGAFLAGGLAIVFALSIPVGSFAADAAKKKPAAGKANGAPATAKGADTGKGLVSAKAGDEPAAGAGGAAAPTGIPEKAVTPAPAGSSPMADLKKSNMALDKALQKNRPNWSPEAELQRAEVRKIVGNFLDYAELARRSLARHWEPLTPKQREEFVGTLRELVERSYLRQIHGNANYNIKYDTEEKKDGEASVTATLNTVSRGKKVNIALEYKMLYKEGHWVVYDVLTDEQSMLENYRAEFNKIITKESFDALLKRMRKKLEEKPEE